MSRRVQCCSSFKHPKIVNWPPWHGQLSSPSKEWHSEQIGRKKGWAKAGSRFKKCRDIFKAKTHNNWQHRTMRPIKYSESIGKQKDFPKEPARAKKKEKGSIDIYRSKLFENMFSKVILYVYIYTSNTYTVMICHASKSPTVVVTICVVTFPSTVFRPPKVDGFGTLAHGVHAPEFFQIQARNQSQRD
jgi:hypothetical protein